MVVRTPPSTNEIAKATGISQPTISRLRSGVRRSSRETVNLLVDLYRLDDEAADLFKLATMNGTDEQCHQAFEWLFSTLPPV